MVQIVELHEDGTEEILASFMQLGASGNDESGRLERPIGGSRGACAGASSQRADQTSGMGAAGSSAAHAALGITNSTRQKLLKFKPDVPLISALDTVLPGPPLIIMPTGPALVEARPVFDASAWRDKSHRSEKRAAKNEPMRTSITMDGVEAEAEAGEQSERKRTLSDRAWSEGELSNYLADCSCSSPSPSKKSRDSRYLGADAACHAAEASSETCEPAPALPPSRIKRRVYHIDHGIENNFDELRIGSPPTKAQRRVVGTGA